MNRILDALWSLRGMKAVFAWAAVGTVVLAVFLAITLVVMEVTAQAMVALGFSEAVTEFATAMEGLFAGFVFMGLCVEFDVLR